MLDRQKGDIVFSCDGCGEVLETKTSNFDAARSRLRLENWRTRKVGNVWQHYCADCAKKL